MTEALVVQFEHRDNAVLAGSTEPNAINSYSAPLGSKLLIFTAGCVEIGQFTLQTSEYGRSPVYTVRQKGAIELGTAADFPRSPGIPPRAHDPCPAPAAP
jgi:hypothetical protein